ncbi:MAG: chemotaxis protein CheD [Rhizomicrobium sp.]
MASFPANLDANGEELRRFFNPQDRSWHIQIMQGDSYVTGTGDEVLTTILGSCIAACIRDPIAGIGGMNHFLLPEGSGDDKDARRFGVNAMEMLINGLIKLGGQRKRFEAKLFGGANVLAQLSDVGSRNSAFAKKYLADEGILVIGGDVGGTSPRRIQYWPLTGRARQLAVRADKRKLVETEITEAKHVPQVATNDVELF